MIFVIGLGLVSLALGIEVSEFWGFIVFGTGLMGVGILNYLNGPIKKGDEDGISKT